MIDMTKTIIGDTRTHNPTLFRDGIINMTAVMAALVVEIMMSEAGNRVSK